MPSALHTRHPAESNSAGHRPHRDPKLDAPWMRGACGGSDRRTRCAGGVRWRRGLLDEWECARMPRAPKRTREGRAAHLLDAAQRRAHGKRNNDRTEEAGRRVQSQPVGARHRQGERETKTSHPECLSRRRYPEHGLGPFPGIHYARSVVKRSPDVPLRSGPAAGGVQYLHAYRQT